MSCGLELGEGAFNVVVLKEGTLILDVDALLLLPDIVAELQLLFLPSRGGLHYE